MTPAPQASLTFSAGVEALRRCEEQRTAIEARMWNALDILAHLHIPEDPELRVLARFVRATAREGLGREPQ